MASLLRLDPLSDPMTPTVDPRGACVPDPGPPLTQIGFYRFLQFYMHLGSIEIRCFRAKNKLE